MGPAGLLLVATLALGDGEVELSWDPAPGATAYRVYACTEGEAKCWGSQMARYWSLIAELATPSIRAPRPTRAAWVAVANVFPGREVIRLGETVYLRGAGPRYVER